MFPLPWSSSCRAISATGNGRSIYRACLTIQQWIAFPPPALGDDAFDERLEALSARTGIAKSDLAAGTFLSMHYAALNGGEDVGMDLSMFCPSRKALPLLASMLPSPAGRKKHRYVPTLEDAGGIATLLSLSHVTAEAYASALLTIASATGDGTLPVRLSQIRGLLEGAWPEDTPESLIVPAAISTGATCVMTQDGEVAVYLDSQYLHSKHGADLGTPLEPHDISRRPIAVAVPILEEMAQSETAWIEPERLARARQIMQDISHGWNNGIPNILDMRLGVQKPPAFTENILAKNEKYSLTARQAECGPDHIEIGALRFRRIQPDLAGFADRVARALNAP